VAYRCGSAVWIRCGRARLSEAFAVHRYQRRTLLIVDPEDTAPREVALPRNTVAAGAGAVSVNRSLGTECGRERDREHAFKMRREACVRLKLTARLREQHVCSDQSDFDRLFDALQELP
jgi:hypothetical protein